MSEGKTTIHRENRDWEDPQWQAERLAQLVHHRLAMMAGILKLSMQCEAAIEEGLVERLVSVLAEKDKLVDRLRECQEQLAPHAELSPDRRHWSSQEARQQCQQEIEQTAELQRAILAVDARCEALMVLRRDQLRETIEQTQGASLAARAYSQHSPEDLSSSGISNPYGDSPHRSVPREGGGIDLTSG